MEKPHQARSLLSRAGGGPTIAAGFGFIGLQLLLFSLIWFTLRAQDASADRADAHGQASAALQQLLRGVNETALTDGSTASRATTTQAVAQYAALAPRLDARATSKAAADDWATLKGRIEKFLALREISPTDVDAMIAVGSITGEAVKLASALDASALAARAEYATAQLNTRLLLAGAALLSLLGTAGIYFMFYRRVTLPLQGAVLVAERVAAGNLTHQKHAGNNGEAASLMLALNQMQSNLAAIVTEVRITTTSIVDASAQLTTGNADLSSRTEEQASTLEETASSME
ncbi:MAG: HAMP domain-containing protein, partial [Usitatibacteraceae bacterium]